MMKASDSIDGLASSDLFGTYRISYCTSIGGVTLARLGSLVAEKPVPTFLSEQRRFALARACLDCLAGAAAGTCIAACGIGRRAKVGI
jgi:hypothetical protein